MPDLPALPRTVVDDLPPAVFGALCLELRPGAQPGRAGLGQHEAAELVERIAGDLIRHAPDAARLDLVLAAAHFDPAELLRPGWPLHRRLAELHARAPRAVGGTPRLIVFGANADGTLPLPLRAETELHGGPLRLLPFALLGESAAVLQAGLQCERDLLEHGMADAATALAVQERFVAPIEHARYLTLHDLAAMMSLQYDHAGLGPLWPLLEAALLAPQREVWLDAPPEPLLRYADGVVRIARFDEQAWWRRYARDEIDPARIARGFTHFEARRRQLGVVLAAHGVDTQDIDCSTAPDPRDALRRNPAQAP